MKTIENRADSSCLECLFSNVAVLVDGDVVCSHCGSRQLINDRGDIFEPVFIDDPEKMYRASRYTPSLPDRRKVSRVMPKIKERRKQKNMVV